MKKIWIAIFLTLIVATSAFGATTAVRTGNRIVITGDAVAHSGDGFDIWDALGWTKGTNIAKIDHYCWYGKSTIVIGDVAVLVTADGAPIGVPLNAVVAGQPLCSPHLVGCTVDRLYVNELTHGSIVIILESIGTK